MENVGAKIIEYLIDFLIQSYWQDENVPRQARALFTSWCLMENVIADTEKCDAMLLRLYNVSGMKWVDVPFEEFKTFMINLIV